MKRRLKTMLLALVAIIMPIKVIGHDFEAGGIYYNITSFEEKTVEVTYSGSSHSEVADEYIGEVIITATVTYEDITYNVRSIGDCAFYDCSSLTNITIPKGATSIENHAFYDCTSLTSITIPEGVKSIRSCAFFNCSLLTSITIPRSVTRIENTTFSGCSSLTNITIPSNVTSIGNSAFYGCSSLASITLPSRITKIENYAFYGCSALTDVHYLDSKENWDNINKGVLQSNSPLTSATMHYYANGFNTEDGAYLPATLNTEGYYEIENGGQLFWFAKHINTIDRTANAKLTADINLENRAWTPIGSTGETNNNFRGHFDGQGYTIEGLNVSANRAGAGLFGEVRLGTVEHFTVKGTVSVTENSVTYVGGVFGSAPGANSDAPDHNGATIRDIVSYVNVSVADGKTGVGRIGGFIGYANHETVIENCAWYGTLDLGNQTMTLGVGGFIGRVHENSTVTITNCAAYGSIVNDSVTENVGAFLGYSGTNTGTLLENCLFAGTVSGDNSIAVTAFGTWKAGTEIRNSYYVNTISTAYTGTIPTVSAVAVTTAQLASGEVAYNLGKAWGQIIGTDKEPVPGGTVVYYGYLSCAKDTQKEYTNNAAGDEKPHSYVDGFCTVCGRINTEGSVIIHDGQHTAFTIAGDIEVTSLTYTRTLPNLMWNALYVPFEIPLTELADNYDVAYINDIRSYDNDANGEIDDMTMEIIRINSGTLNANHPYLIRAKNEEAQSMEIVLSDATLYRTEEISLNCSSMYMEFTITGTYNTLSYADLEEKYAISTSGAWQKLSEESSLKPFRLYMEMTPRDGSPVKVEAAALSRIRINMQGEDGNTTGVEILEAPQSINDAVLYDLYGRKVTTPVKGGIYISNGKKVIVK